MKTKKFMEIFAREAEEHLQVLRRGVLVLEQEEFSREQVHELLRSAHTLKGSARMLDLGDLARVAHQMESLLKDLEEGRRPVSPELADLLLVSTDALEALVAQAHSGGEVAVNVDAVLEGLETGVMPKVAPPAPAATEPEARTTGESVRTSVAQLDRMFNLLGETLIVRRSFGERGRQLGQLLGRLDGFLGGLRKAEKYRQLKGILDDFQRLSLDLEGDTLDLGYLAEELHGGAMQLRMVPLESITDEMQRAVRDLARDQGKEVELLVRGEQVELDRTILEAAKPMFLHMLRNAVDHGIEVPEDRVLAGKPERGRVVLAARYEGGFVHLTLKDDGQGIDPERIREVAVERRLITAEEARGLSDEEAVYLILRPGFTTRTIITDVSGRGVGMDVVKTNIDRVKGNLVIHSAPGEGTEMFLQVPLTLAVIAGLVVECEGETFAIPLHYISEILRLSEGDILTEGGREVVRVRGATLPLLSLGDILGLPRRQGGGLGGTVTVLVLSFREQQLACLISRSGGVQDLVVKGMGQQLKSVEFFSGATILGDGSPALILSIPDLFGVGLAGKGTRLRQEFAATREEALRGRVLVVDDSITTRTMEKNILQTQGYDVTVAISGEEALAKVAGAEFDLVVTDVEMPGIDGFELTRRLRELQNYAEVPVIIVTSRASDDDRRMGIEVGAQAYIVKGSFDQGTLLQTVETLIG
ncbi:hybrid sensor histidine kinase/response regulator [uncultured Desulfuromonas sp.]|uniref:hybrid sensor histidine kinase/response regulator n=1 Tax=uncultured Desulfuromonas sp. TaxID=181013 RepID=UPI002618441E|nr:hybrid sensor histidine kinase/response regulator [uncultured Desulfuromonas sp.]